MKSKRTARCAAQTEEQRQLCLERRRHWLNAESTRPDYNIARQLRQRIEATAD